MRSLTGATEPDYGTMFDDWFVLEASTVSRERMNRPLVEVEIAFVLRQDLPGPAVNAADVIRATDFVLPCIEIVDSRQKGRGPNMLVDSISDAASCGLVVLGGRPIRLVDVDLRRIGASLAINGVVEESGVASAVMGNPINSIAWLANKLHEYGTALEAGHVLLSGSFIKAIPFQSGDSVGRAVRHTGRGHLHRGVGDALRRDLQPSRSRQRPGLHQGVRPSESRAPASTTSSPPST